MFELETTKRFKEKLKTLNRKQLLELIASQNPEYISEIRRFEEVFANKLQHLFWEDGSPVEGRPLTNDELRLLIDPPFIFDPDTATEYKLNEQMQKQIHYASDPVLWNKHFLGLKPRVYQILILRNPNLNRIMRFGRRSGKSFTFAMFLLWYCYTRQNGKIIVLAPMKSQVGLIYEAVKEIASKSDIVYASIIRSVASPQYEINFSNGSFIRLFTTGMKSSSKSDIIRGQEAHVIVLDEMDYMGPEDLVAVIPMLQKTQVGQEAKFLLAASTPTGQRNMFWDWCHDDKFYHLWAPSYVNPAWDDEENERLRIGMTEMQWRHEYEADWGEDVQGVYPKRLIDLAFINFSNNEEDEWSYTLTPSHQNSFYVFGVDWDKYAADGGVNIVVLEVCNENFKDKRFAERIRLIYREEMTKDEFLLTKAVDRILMLNSIFRPRHIYIDKGYGEVQSEMLRKYGMEHPETNLHKTVVAWQFNQSIEVADPWSGQMEKKPLKPFMVENLRYMLEREMIFFSETDEDLYMQLLSYVVLKQSIDGRPVYGSTAPDHAHDALILAAFAVTHNYEELLNPSFARRGAVVQNEAFLPLFDVTSEKEEEIVESIWGDAGSAPVYARRFMTHNTSRRKRPGDTIKRGMF